MADIATLGIKVTTQGVDKATRQLDNLGDAADEAASKVGKSTKGMTRDVKAAVRDLESLKRPLQVVGIGLAAAFAGGALLAVSQWRAAFKDLKQTLATSREVGVSAEQFSRLEFAARASDVAVEDLTAGMRNLARFMTEAAKGGKEQAGLLDQLGVAAKNADGSLRPMHDVLRDVADQFPRIQDPTNRAALAVKLFGEQGAKLAPLLAEGAKGLDRMAAKSDKLGYTLNGQVQTGAEGITRKLAEMKLTMDGLWRQSLGELLPRLDDLATLLNSPQFKSGFQALVSGATSAATAFADLIGKIGQVSEALKTQDKQTVQFLQDQINAYQREIDAINADPTGVWKFRAKLGFDNQKVIDDLKAQMAPLQAEIDRRMQITLPAVEAVLPSGNKPLTIDWGALGGGGDFKLPNFRRDNSLREALEEAQRLAEAQANWRDRMLDLQAQLAGPMAEVIRQHERDMGELDAAYARGEVTLADYARVQELLTQARDRDADALRKQLTPAQQVIADLQFENQLLGATRDEYLRLTAARLAGVDATREQVAETYRLLTANEQLAEAQRNWEELNHTIADSLYDVITNAESAGDAIKGFLDSLNSQILRNIAQDWADALTDWMKGAARASGGGAGGGGWIAGLLSAFGFARGGYTGDGPRNQVAGVVHRGEYVLDADTTRRIGRDNLAALSSGRAPSGGTPHYQAPVMNFNVAGHIDRRSAGAIASASGRAIQQALARA